MKKKYIAASLAALCAAGGAMTVHAEDMPVYTLDWCGFVNTDK